jgi:hypothetical protein
MKPAPLTCDLRQPIGQSVTSYEYKRDGWYIIKRDSYNRAYWGCGPYKTQKASRKADAASLGY